MSIEKDVFKRCSFDYNKLLEYGFVIDKDKLIDYIKEHPEDVVIMNGKQLKEVFKL